MAKADPSDATQASRREAAQPTRLRTVSREELAQILTVHRKHPRTAARLWRTRVAASGYDGGWLMQPQRLQALG